MRDSEQTIEDYLIVRVGAEYYALPGVAIREVTRWRAPTPVPGAPPILPGIISQRGVVLATVDLRQMLGMPATEPERAARFVIVRQEPTDIALMVDATLDLYRLSDADLARPPAGLDQQRARLLQAVAQYEGQPLLVIDLAALVTMIQESA
jgi:purine-binding chemotaxis protein CheW